MAMVDTVYWLPL